MESSEYKTIKDNEHSHWWYKSLHSLIIKSIGKLKDKTCIIDAGCGTGGLIQRCPDIHLGFDYSNHALPLIPNPVSNNILQASVNKIPIKSNTASTIISCDVLYHQDVNDEQAIDEFHRILKSNGILILHLPAYNFLKSTHDKQIHTKKRYTTRQLSETLSHLGFEIKFITYRNTFLFPVAAFKRILDKFSPTKDISSQSDVKTHSRFLNSILFYIMRVENFLLTVGVKFPYGLSVFCIAKKKNGTANKS
jgi:SAM-dependent methyltransferase